MPIETAWWHWAWNLYALDGGHSVISSSDLESFVSAIMVGIVYFAS